MSRYSVPLHFKGLTIPTVMKYSGLATGFGVSLGLFAVFFFGEVPRVREDILMKVPVIGNYWERSIPEQDNLWGVFSPQVLGEACPFGSGSGMASC
ncbi:hypothetical protein AJ80_01227 [Polytolypa hystricis UAMH7299]|uniref:Uncharacterized protein n=1 Tax=Polytolypa hystricis (strain UAMH7299) TaxID=1447883 RepID=A0A2B7Z1T7_POLH7|nr:hypothetical protein AJ80_01227 [Polytolypa hystricis UAMH7299]